MVPAAPLDGGKVLSSAIWRATGSQSTAMTWSGAAGIVAGMALATYGFRRLQQPDAGTIGWFCLIVGGFVAWAAFQQVRTAPLYKALDGMTVATAMASHPPTAASWTTVGDFLRSSSPRPRAPGVPGGRTRTGR